MWPNRGANQCFRCLIKARNQLGDSAHGQAALAGKGPQGCGPLLSRGLDPLMGTTVTPPPALKHAAFNYYTKVCLSLS